MEENFGNTEPGEGPDGSGVGEGVAEGEGKLTLGKMLEQDHSNLDGQLYRAAVHRRRTWLRLRLQ